jgi:predicted ATPase
MVSAITKISIRRLHGSLNISVPVRDNRLLLVGVNGLGKSTFINCLYFVLSKQWQRLREVDFESIRIDLKGSHLTINKSDLADVASQEEEALSLGVVRGLERLRATNQLDLFLSLSEREAENFGTLSDISPVSRRRLHHYARTSLGPKREIEDAVSSIVGNAQILYLPTYRRIEKDLRTIIPEIDKYLRRYHDVDEDVRGKGRRIGRQTDVYVELVEFGMEDVQAKFAETLGQLRENARREFGSLAGNYLRDIIRGEGHVYDRKEIEKLTDESIASILRRVEENTLGQSDKQLLLTRVKQLKSAPYSKEKDDNAYVAHFFSKLVRSVETLKLKESAVTRFVALCNKYLEGKGIVYDDQRYELAVRDVRQRPIELASLSSGEKQIISLFSHVYLDENRKYILIIDEPELSLSVPWQQSLLPDLMGSGQCEFLAAVTHSPFIFENELDSYAQDMRDCVTIK